MKQKISLLLILLNLVVLFFLLSFVKVPLLLSIPLLLLLAFKLICWEVFECESPSPYGVYIYLTTKYVNLHCKFILRTKIKGGAFDSILSLFFVIRSIEARNVITISLMILSIFILNYFSPSDEPLLYSIFSSVFAACFFDFVIIRLPDEIKKKRYSESIGISVSYIQTIKKSMLYALGNEDFFSQAIDRYNFELNLNRYLRSNCGKPVESTVIFGDQYIQSLMIKRIKMRRALTGKSHISVNDYLCICIMVLNYIIDDLLSKDELHLFPDVRVSILNLKSAMRNDIESTFINVNYEVNQKAIYDLELGYSHRMSDFLEHYILPMETVEFWYVRKMRKYSRNYGLSNSNFSCEATKMHLKNMQDRLSISLY